VIPYEYVDEAGDRLLSDWPLDARERRALIVMLYRLFRTDAQQAIGSFIFKEPEAGIYYAKATGRVQLRPRLCRGPHRPNDEVTFLVRAEERNWRTIPRNASKLAAELLPVVTTNAARRIRYRPMPPAQRE
jgi:hypothetical protein